MAEPIEPIDLIFRVRAEDAEALQRDLNADASLAPEVIRAAGAAGGGELVTVLVPMVSASLTFLAGIVTVWVNRPRASVEIDGIKVTGVSQSIVEKLLRERISAADQTGTPATSAKPYDAPQSG